MDLFILCIEIFFARILDVSMGTVKTIMMVRGKTVFSAILGFLEVFIWFRVVKDALSRCGNLVFDVTSRKDVEDIMNSFYNFRKSLRFTGKEV